VFGKRASDGDGDKPLTHAPPPTGGAPIATRPQPVDPAMAKPAPAPAAARSQSAMDRLAGAHATQKTSAAGAGPKATSAFEQLRAAQGVPTAEIVREQSD
jgi:pilus assembly protein CpaF